MERLLEIALINAASVTLLALAVTLIGRFVKRPAVMHALWLLVLIKLVTPPLFEVATLPSQTLGLTALTRATALPSSPAPLSTADSLPGNPDPSGSARSSWAGPTPAQVLVGGWLTGGVLLLGLAIVRLRRFEELIRRAGPAPLSLERRVGRIARRLGLPRRPRVGLVEGRVPPMLWSRLGPCRILVPCALIDRLDDDELDALIAHELAHLRRHDHWVRHLEVASTALFWWHPLVWWVRRRLRLEEEKSCDALVLRTFPGRSRAYAEGLLKTVEFLSGRETGVPALATGAGETRQLSERLTMILNQRVPLTTTRTQRWTIAAVAAAVLLIFPTWAEPDNAPPDTEDPSKHEMLDLRRQSIELERQMQAIELQRMEVERAMRAVRLDEEMDELQTRLDEFEAQGEVEHATKVRAVIDKARRRHELAERQLELQLRAREEMRPVELELQQLLIEVEGSRLAGDVDRTADLESRAAEIERRLRDVAEESGLMRRELHGEMMSAHAAELAHEAGELARAGHEEQARRVADRIAKLEEQARVAREEEAQLDRQLAREGERRARASREEEARLLYERARDIERARSHVESSLEDSHREMIRARETELRRLERGLAAQELAEALAARELAEQRRLEERGPAGPDEIRRLSELQRDLERKLDAVESRDDAGDAESVRRLRMELRKIELELDRLETD